ncbi:MAG TPA: hypothetical protein VF054_00360 [Micromonosporaceae bacterium]
MLAKLKTSLTDSELDAVVALVDEVCADPAAVDEPGLRDAARRRAGDLPERIRVFLGDLGDPPTQGFRVLSGFGVDERAVGPTPTDGDVCVPVPAGLRQELAYFLLCASLLGEASSMRDVLPGKAGDSGSFGWRTLDVTAAVRPDYVAMICLRNDDDLATLVCDVGEVDTGKVDVDLLFAPDYPVLPDGPGSPVRAPVLHGDRARPFLTVDPDRTVREQLAPDALAAFDAFTRAVDDALTGVVLWPGDIVVVDNRRAVHGQEPSPVRHDGTDQWLKRVTITRHR